jgi:long-chain acyl-CoA synthetase
LQREASLVTYRELDREVGATADALRVPGIRAGDRMMLVSESSIPLACVLSWRNRSAIEVG